MENAEIQRLLEQRDKRRAYARKYYKKNRQKVLDERKRWRNEHHEEYLEKQRQYCMNYYEKNKDRLREKKKVPETSGRNS